MKITSLLAAALAVSLSNLNAALITLGGPLPGAREAALSDAQSGAANSSTGTGNATVDEVEAAFGGDWTERASATSPGTSGWLDVVVNSGSFGTTPAAGTWSINNANFWTSFGEGAISLHVGNGGGDPDHFIWKLTQGAMSGTWSYNGTSEELRGGGLSNLKLYSTGTGNRVPDGGTSIALLGMALIGLGGARKVLGKL
jgi:hypothetical protein